MKNNIRQSFFNLLHLELTNFYINKNDKRGLHRIKYSITYILNIIIDKIITGISWRDVSLLKSNSFNTSYCVIYYMYNKMIKNNIIFNAYNNLLKTYCIKIDNSCAYIDSTYIINKYGYNTNIKFNNYVMIKHKTSKLSIISSKNGVPLGISIGNSLEHDIKMVLKTIPKHPLFTKLYGDKGYVGKEFKKELKEKNGIDIITYPKKNQKNIIISSDDKKALHNRYVIEHLNNFIKQNKQIQTRYIKRNDMFLGYIYFIFIKRALEIFL